MAPRRPDRRDRGRGDDRAEEPRLRGHRRHPGRERALRGGGGRDHLRPLLHVATHLDRPELVAGGRRRRRGPPDRPRWHRCGAAGRGDRGPDRGPVPARRRPQARLACELPLAGGRDRVPRRRRDRRRHRRAAQAHRNLRRRRECLAGARVVGSGPRRPQPGDVARRRGCPCRHPRASVRGSEGPGGARPRRRRPDRLGPPRPGSAGSRAGGPRAARSAASAGAIDRGRVAEPPDDRDLGLRAPAHRVLPDRGRCPGIRDEASVSGRPQPGVGCPGNGERRRRLLPGHARVDQPVGELAERGRRGQDAGRLARDRRDRPRDADPARAALLRAAQGRPGARSSSTRSSSG